MVNGSIAYAGIIGNEFRLLYSFGGPADRPTSEYYNFSLIGDSLFGRFKWFDGSFEGYTHLKVLSKNKLEGGWWHSKDVPEPGLKNLSKLKIKNFSQWIRQTDPADEPSWAKEYFQMLNSK